MNRSLTEKLITDGLGFTLEVIICFRDFGKLGEHRTHQNCDTGKVERGTVHKLSIKSGLDCDRLNYVIAHETYHLFYSVRHLITVDEETEAEVFGDLVCRVHRFYKECGFTGGEK